MLDATQTFDCCISSITTICFVQFDRNLLPEIAEFDSFVRESGKCGGWHTDDHSEFLRILQAAKGNYEACQATAAAQLFHIEPAAILKHVQ